MASTACGTCRERKLSCDKTLPNCLRCVRSARVCAGYEFRLNWPKDRSRALVASTRAVPGYTKQHSGEHQWINVIPTDMRLHLATSNLLIDENNDVKREQLVFPDVLNLKPSLPSHAANQGVESIQYFKSVVVYLLPGLSIDRSRLSDVLVRLALLEDTQSSRAVYQAILALVACHRGANFADVQKFKRAALRDLRIDADLTTFQGLQHVAANLLLSVLGLQQTFPDHECNSDWLGYLISSKKISGAINKGIPAPGSEHSIILGWIYYFEVMARFTFRHWRTEDIKANVSGLGFDPDGSEICALQFILARATFIHGVPAISAHAHPVIQVLAEVSAISMYPTHSNYTLTEYQQILEDLRTKLDIVKTTPIGLDAYSEEVIRHEQDLLGLGRLAALIYLERVSSRFSGRSPKLDAWTHAAVSTIARMETCLAPFALFIVSCELDSDEDRLVILRLFGKMEQRPHLRSLMEIRSLIQTAWNQQDLAGPGGLEYVHKLNLVISSRDVMPSLI